MNLKDQNKWRSLFEIPPEVCYFNSASWSLQPRETSQIGLQAVIKKQQAWKIQIDDFFTPVENLRSEFAKLINSTIDHVAIVPSASFGVETAVKNLKFLPNKKVLVPQNDFPSDIYPYLELQKKIGFELVYVQKSNLSWTDTFLNAIDENTQLVSVPNCDWSNGSSFDLIKISEKCKKVGAHLVLDLSQSLGAVPIDIQKIQPDFMFCVGYKWQLGPYGLSYLWVHEKHWQGVPLDNNWINRCGSENFSELTNYTDEYQKGARRFDSGQRSHFVLAPMALTSLKLLNQIGVPNINRHLVDLTDDLIEKIESLGFKCTSKSERLGHMFGIYVAETNLAQRIISKLKEQNIFVSLRGNYIRISPHLYNSHEDSNRFVESLRSINQYR